MAANAPDKLQVGAMYCRLDQGGDLGKSIKLCKLLTHYRYLIQPIATNKPRQKGFVEVKTCEIDRRLQSMHYGSRIDYKYWLHSITNSARVDNICLHSD